MRNPGSSRLKLTTRRVLAAGLTALAVGGVLSPGSATANTATANTAACQDLAVPVTLAGLPQTVYGRFCRPAEPTSTVLVLVPGATYTSEYWDLPANLGLVSFRAGMNGHGYATLAIDRLGSGRSSRPASALLTTLTQADVLHQIVGRLRAGEIGPGYPEVVVGGHSLGAAISLVEAANYHDVDGVLSAGVAHYFDPVDSAADLVAALYPASLDPLLAKQNLDPGYLTTMPGTRSRAFHRPAQPSAAVLAYEESAKAAFASTELATSVPVMTPYTVLIDAPVLAALGGRDELYCGVLVGTDCSSAEAFRDQEAPNFSPAARLRTYLLPGGYGHSFNFAPNAHLFHEEVARWLDEVVSR